jgi:predicted nucleotidyltransferase
MSKPPLAYERDIDDRVRKFKKVLEGQEQEEVVVQKYILHGTPYVFKDNEDKYFDLKREIAANFSEHYSNIHMVGSAKLGFSIAPNKLWNPFTIDSDIDIVIVSTKMFEDLWKDVHEFNINLISRTEKEDRNYKRFLEYFFKGWLRPDLLPFSYSVKTDWFDFFTSISYKKYDPQKITGALYHSFNFFEKYHVKNIAKLRIGDD